MPSTNTIDLPSIAALLEKLWVKNDEMVTVLRRQENLIRQQKDEITILRTKVNEYGDIIEDLKTRLNAQSYQLRDLRSEKRNGVFYADKIAEIIAKHPDRIYSVSEMSGMLSIKRQLLLDMIGEISADLRYEVFQESNGRRRYYFRKKI